jgi:hypothetical protein
VNKINLLWLLLVPLAAFRADAGDVIWQELNDLQARAAGHSQRQFIVNAPALRQSLQAASLRRPQDPPQSITLPMPDGSMARFRIEASPIMEEGLARRYPDIKTYKVYGIDDASATGRLDMTVEGFHAMLHTAQGRLFIDPKSSPQSDRYVARSQGASITAGYRCGVDDFDFGATSVPTVSARAAARISGSLLQYRLAVSATAEYVAAVGGSVALAQAAIVTAINRVDEIYERDLGIQLMLVAKNDQLIENGNNVIFTNGDALQMFDQNQAWIDSVIGSSNYDIGHVFGTGSGGLAYLGSVCDSLVKAQGVSGIANPLGDPFYIDFVAHEIGHQFNADHSFNGTTLSCISGRNAVTAFEPGSGSSIMAYAGLCGVEDLQSNSDATFHAGSIAQINSFTASAGGCYTQIATAVANPNDPLVSTLASRTIPANTAFVLDGSATDADGQTLTYQWDQMDAGCPTDANSYGTDIGSNPLFRSYLPRDVARRNFPALGTQLQGFYDDAEVVPCNTRELNFRLTARDNFSGQGSADINISVADTGAAFEITNLNDGKTINTQQLINVNWRVAGTNVAPINCSKVDIHLLTFSDNYASYSEYPLEINIPNDGTETVNFPISLQAKSHPRARIRVKCSDNIFYDISDASFAVVGTTAELIGDTDNLTFFNNNGTTGTVAPACGAVVQCDSGSDGTNASSGGGSGALDYRWLLFMAGLLMLAARRAGTIFRVCSEA